MPQSSLILSGCIHIIHIIYIWTNIELEDFFNGFLKIKRKETQINVIAKDKSSEIHIVNLSLKIVIAKNYWTLKLIQNFIFDDHV